MDDLKEFEQAISEIEVLKEKEIYGLQSAAKISAYNAAIVKINIAIAKWRKRHTEQNSGLSVEVFDDSELSDNIKSNVCGFGDEE